MLTAYGDKTIEYDIVGNPTKWGDDRFAWANGRELALHLCDGVTWAYTYDSNGMRTSRSSSIATYEYIYNGSQLVQMTVGDNTLYFTSDTVTLNGTTYYYVTNLQGDIVAI